MIHALGYEVSGAWVGLGERGRVWECGQLGAGNEKLGAGRKGAGLGGKGGRGICTSAARLCFGECMAHGSALPCPYDHDHAAACCIGTGVAGHGPGTGKRAGA